MQLFIYEKRKVRQMRKHLHTLANTVASLGQFSRPSLVGRVQVGQVRSKVIQLRKDYRVSHIETYFMN